MGVSVTNALSKRLELVVWREGAAHLMEFANGDVAEPLKVVPELARKKSGTRVRVWPDASFFDSAVIPIHELMHLLRSKAVLMAGVKVT